MEPLQLFYNNENEREAVKAFMIKVLRELSADAALEGEDTKGFKEAKDMVDKMFDKLDELYGIIKEPANQNSR